MPFQHDVAFAGEETRAYGVYHSSFNSQTGQVWAHLFEQNGRLVAHVAFRKGLKPDDLTDNYLDDLNRYAADHDFAGKLRIIYAG